MFRPDARGAREVRIMDLSDKARGNLEPYARPTAETARQRRLIEDGTAQEDESHFAVLSVPYAF
jgi:hypothetical protein